MIKLCNSFFNSNSTEENLPEIRYTTSHNQIRDILGDNDFQKYRVAKSTLVVGVSKTLRFDTPKPSAKYAIPLATDCMGLSLLQFTNNNGNEIIFT